MPSILIYEDNNNLRESICTLLSFTDEYKVVGEFSNCMLAESQVAALKPDVILMDIDMPGATGIEAVGKIRAFDAVTQIIMLTVFDDSENVFNAIVAGANGYLLKKHISDRLVKAIAEALDGGAPMSPSIARMVLSSMQRQKPSVHYNLTAREKEILMSLSRGNSFKMIAAELNISMDTIRTHTKHIYEKLQVNSNVEAVSKALNEKLV